MFEYLYKIPEKLADLLIKLREEKHRRDRETALYFTDLADTLEMMVKKLKQHEVPRSEGHKFQKLILSFENKTKNLAKEHTSDIVSADLVDIANKAKQLDVAQFVYLPDIEKERAEWLREMERIVGDCRGIAGVLETGS